ncbi:MAG: metallophosphoesterase [Balneolaceae bacterium]|nr:metallophosphoesterase [Balneolaceae bacterium]
MLIGIISDTHDHVPHTQEAVEQFRQRDVDLVLHAGDYCSPFIIPHFEGLNFKGILGNNDGDLHTLMQKFDDIGAELAGGFLELEAGGLSIAMYHGTHEGITNSLHRSGNYDVVISGHTHEQVNSKMGNTQVINPGTAHGFGDQPSIAILDTDSRKVSFVELNS